MDLDPDQLRTIASSYRLSQLVYSCASLGLPDALSRGPQTFVQVARTVGADEGSVHRLMRAAASEGILSYADGHYAINEFSRQLCSDGDQSLRDLVLGWSVLRPNYVAFGYLDEAVRTAKSGIELAYGERFHSYLRSHPDDRARYDSAMESTVDGFREAAASFDFSRFAQVVDVGGGQGGFLVAIIERYAHISGVLFDLPEVVDAAPTRLASYPQANAISIVGGNMFNDLPRGGDAYLFSTVLRCFDDDECKAVLRLCAERMAPEGHLIALEMVMSDGIPPSPLGLADLQALVVYGGKDRTETEWTTLLAGVGFAAPVFHPAGGAYTFIDAVRA
ncbi:MAG: methyltransferase [Acidimicrobiales bacterium]